MYYVVICAGPKRPGIRDIGQDKGRPEKHIVLNDRACVNRDVVLHLHIGTDHHSPATLRFWPKINTVHLTILM